MLAIFLITACGTPSGNKPYGDHKDHKMIGTVISVDLDINTIEVNISEWEKRDISGPLITFEAYFYTAEITNETVIRYEDGTPANLKDIKRGQKVLVNPPRGDDYRGEVEQFILMEMSFKEKYSRFLPYQEDMLHVVVIDESDEVLPFDIEDPIYENILKIVKNRLQTPGVTRIAYDETYAVDYKQELDIDQFPVFLIFSYEELVYKTYDVEEIYEFFRDSITYMRK